MRLDVISNDIVCRIYAGLATPGRSIVIDRQLRLYQAAWDVNMRWFRLRRASSCWWVPSSTMRPPSSTRMRSASRGEAVGHDDGGTAGGDLHEPLVPRLLLQRGRSTPSVRPARSCHARVTARARWISRCHCPRERSRLPNSRDKAPLPATRAWRRRQLIARRRPPREQWR